MKKGDKIIFPNLTYEQLKEIGYSASIPHIRSFFGKEKKIIDINPHIKWKGIGQGSFTVDGGYDFPLEWIEK